MLGYFGVFFFLLHVKLGMFSLWLFFSIIIKYRKQFPFIQQVLSIVSTFQHGLPIPFCKIRPLPSNIS